MLAAKMFGEVTPLPRTVLAVLAGEDLLAAVVRVVTKDGAEVSTLEALVGTFRAREPFPGCVLVHGVDVVPEDIVLHGAITDPAQPELGHDGGQDVEGRPAVLDK